MLSCKEIVKILNAEESVPFLKRAELKMHLLMCEHCSAYSKHIKFMKLGFKKLFAKLTQTEPETVERIEKKAIEQFKKTTHGR